MNGTNPYPNLRLSSANKAPTLDYERATMPDGLPKPPSRYVKNQPRFANRKVLIIVENQSVPSDPRVWKEALSLHENGYEVTILCPRSASFAKQYETIEGIRIYRHPMPGEPSSSGGYLWEYSCALFWEFVYSCRIYLRHGFHVIEGCNPPDDIFLVALPFKLLGVKYIFDHHDAGPELYLSKYNKKGFFYKILLWLEKQSYRFSDVVMATNNSYRELAMARGHRALDDVFVVRNGPDLEKFRAVRPNPKLKHGKSYLIGYVGNMGTQDGLDILLDVARHIKNSGRSDIHFTCVGGGPEQARLRKMAESMNLSEMVNFTGRIPDAEMLAILSTADVCVNPDRPCEMNDISTMIKIMEYMALAKPIVQFDSKEGRFSAEGASLYADKKDPVNDFASKLLWLLDNTGERRRMGELGRRRVEDALAWKYSVPHLLAAYQRAFGGNES
jgi:glycosyltransferase involved in cell wall biosynthesis